MCPFRELPTHIVFLCFCLLNITFSRNMIHQVLIVCAVAVFGGVQARGVHSVDPNSLSCDPDGQIFLLLPSFTECNQFYTCDNGQEVPMQCAPGTIFDFPLQTCNHPWATECWLRTQASDSSEDSGSEDIEGSGAGEEEWEVNQDSAPIDAAQGVNVEDRAVFGMILDCSRPETAAMQVAYKADCQRYWRCENGVAQAVYCSDGLFFNQKTMQCDHEANAACNVNSEYELDGEFIVSH